MNVSSSDLQATCREVSDALHIGKSSFGWCFSLHVMPELHINTLADWNQLWGTGVIRDEYGNIHSPDDMLLIITARRGLPFDGRA